MPKEDYEKIGGHYCIDSKEDYKNERTLPLSKELTKEEEDLVSLFLMCYHTDTIMSLNKQKVFKVTDNDGSYKASLNEGVVLSKANFKELAKIGSKSSYWGQSKLNTKDMEIKNYDMPKIFEITIKTLKYKQEDLKTILENRLAGTYSKKFDNGQTWNAGGIGAPIKNEVVNHILGIPVAESDSAPTIGGNIEKMVPKNTAIPIQAEDEYETKIMEALKSSPEQVTKQTPEILEPIKITLGEKFRDDNVTSEFEKNKTVAIDTMNDAVAPTAPNPVSPNETTQAHENEDLITKVINQARLKDRTQALLERLPVATIHKYLDDFSSDDLKKHYELEDGIDPKSFVALLHKSMHEPTAEQIIKKTSSLKL